MKKKILSVIVSFCFISGIFSVSSVKASEYNEYDGIQYGDYLYYIVNDDNSSVTITDCDENAISIVIPNEINSLPVTNISDYAFSWCSNLVSITIADSVISIGEEAFLDCNKLSTVIIPNNVTTIGDRAFGNCSSLTNITIGNGVTNINYATFSGCSSLIEIIIPDSVIEIDQAAFENCKSLTNITIPNCVEDIGYCAFEGCSGLVNISIGKGVKNLNRGTFNGCNNLTNINVDENNPNYYTIDNVLFSYDKELVKYPAQKDDEVYSIPDSVICVGMQAFYNCDNLTSVIIGNNVSSIDSGAFEGCKNLTNVTISNSVTSIGNNAFKDCENLTSVNISSSVTEIHSRVFENCKSLTNITIPDSITYISPYTFRDCINLTEVTVPNSVTSIGDVAFGGCINLTNFSIPNSVTSIGDSAFAACRSLKKITIPNSVTYVSAGAFRECHSLTNIVIPNSLTSIRKMMFYLCTNLTSITIPNSVTNIDESAFSLCSITDVYYNGTEEQWREISANANISSDVKIHLSSGKTFTPTNTNPSKPSSGDSDYAYGISGGSGRGHKKTTDVRERLKNSAEKFNKAALEYTATVSRSAKKQVGSADDIEALAKKLETENRILFTSSPDSKTKQAAYIGYAKYLNQMIEEGISLNKINLSDNAVMIDYKLTSQILSKLRGKKLSYEYKGYTIKINSLAISKSYFGTLDVFTPKSGKISAMISSDTNKTMADLQDFANQLKDVAQDVNKKALRAVVSDLVNLTGLGNLGAMIARDGLKSYKPLTKLGYGDVVKNVKKCYSGYETVKGILNCAQISSLDSIIDNPKQLTKKINNLCEHESDIENAVVNAAQNKLIDSIYNLLYASQDYEEMRNGKQPTFQERVKDFFDKTTSWISSIFQCPVDFTVYDENGEMIGYVDDGAVYYNDDIYIEVNGDVKTLYVPVGMKVDIKMTGTDEGEFNYIVEEVIYNQPTGRLNYYGLPLSEGVEYTQNLNTTEFDNSTDVLPITSQDGNVLPNEYISSEDTTAYVIINADSNNGGTVLGGGEYAKGDSVELSTVPMNSNYEFNGWYVEDELISVDNIYRFTAIENTDIHAEFMRVYNEDNAYAMEIPDTSGDLYSYVYKDSDDSKGIVLVPFTEEVADNMQIYVNTYAADGSILNNDVLYSATLNENGIYAFENVDLENATKIIIKDENNIEIAAADYDSNKDIDNISIEVSDKYSDSLNVTACEELGNIIVNFDILDDKINQDDIVAYLVEYDENGVLLNCTILDRTTTENGIGFDAYLEDNYKLMFWDNNMCPITETVTTDLFEV